MGAASDKTCRPALLAPRSAGDVRVGKRTKAAPSLKSASVFLIPRPPPSIYSLKQFFIPSSPSQTHPSLQSDQTVVYILPASDIHATVRVTIGQRTCHPGSTRTRCPQINPVRKEALPSLSESSADLGLVSSRLDATSALGPRLEFHHLGRMTGSLAAWLTLIIS